MDILCKPRSLFNWNFEPSGSDWSGSTLLRHFTEQRELVVNGQTFAVVKDGFFSGQWRLEENGKTILTAHKPNPLTRRFLLTGQGVSATLAAANPLRRVMVLSTARRSVEIRPGHPFTRRARITGDAGDEIDARQAAFAFWLSILTWRRAASNNGGGAGG